MDGHKTKQGRKEWGYGAGAAVFTVAAGLLATWVIVFLTVRSYSDYKKDLIEMQQEELLTMAETVGASLVNFINQELARIDLYYDTAEEQREIWDAEAKEQASAAFLDSGDELYVAEVCFDAEGQRIYEQGKVELDVERIPGGDRAVICGKRLDVSQKRYEMYISRRFSCGNEEYTAVYAMNLDAVYDRIVEPVRIGDGGYSVVKDSSLSIIMHHAPDQIGMDAVYDRSQRYPELDLTDLFAWIQLQQEQPAGVGLINSYQWDDEGPNPNPEKRVVAYTTIQLPGESWIVNSTIPYEELNGPLNRMIQRLAWVSGCFLLMVALFVYVTTKSVVRYGGQKREIAYLKEINEGMELLYRKEEQIQQYQRMQSVGQMSSRIAHEFNNYLTPVMVYGGLLETDETISAENQELVRGILDAASQAADLSRKLLDFSRQDSSVRLTAVNLTEGMRQAVDMIRQLVPESVSFRAELEERDFYIKGRAGMAEQILMNLCNNAFHAMENTGGSLSVIYKTFVPPPEGQENLTESSWAVLRVKDTGCGISKEAQEKIFEPFYTTKGRGKGTGLGLAVIQNMVSVAGGSIRLESEPGKGTEFFLYFPETEADVPETSGENGREVSRVGVVDDDPEMLRTLELLLSRKGYKVRCWSHPAVVLSKLQKKRELCDVILTDYSMPSINGLEFAEMVRKLNPGIRLILMSGKEEEKFFWYLKNGFLDGFILKTDIGEHIDEVL